MKCRNIFCMGHQPGLPQNCIWLDDWNDEVENCSARKLRNRVNRPHRGNNIKLIGISARWKNEHDKYYGRVK